MALVHLMILQSISKQLQCIVLLKTTHMPFVQELITCTLSNIN